MNVTSSNLALLSLSWSTEDPPHEPTQRPISESLFWRFFPDLDLTTVYTMWSLFWPTFGALLLQYATTLVSVAFCGHLGEDQLGSVGLANSVIAVSGLAVVIGITGAGDTLGAQAYGAKNYQRVSIIFHKGVLILGLALFPAWALWVNMDRILIKARQPAAVAEGAWHYLMVVSPGLIGLGLFQLLRSYVQVQGIVKPVALTCLMSLFLNILFNYVFIYPLDLRLTGAAIATCLANFSMSLFLALYIYTSKVYIQTWTKPSKQCLVEWQSYVRLGLSGMMGQLISLSGNEISTFLMGVLGKSELGAQTVLSTVRTFLAMISIGMTIVLCIMTGRELGAGNPRRTQQTGKLIISFSLVIYSILSVILFTCKDIIGSIFTKDKEVLEKISDAFPFMIISLFCYSLNNTFAGILLGCAKQNIFTLLVFTGSYVIGIPLGIVLTFVQQMGIVGMWIGLATGMFIQLGLSFICVFWIIDYTVISEATANVTRVVATVNDKPTTYGSINFNRESENICVQGEEDEVHDKDTSKQADIVQINNKVVMKRTLTLLIFISILLVSILIKEL